ncbi:MAG: NAD(P)-dependent alcohol dehydrogenase [Saprospirales bacterium]|nr:NAD(P)-dependent alcohol dehydrogenase [Saprospirales bacterium]
MKAVICPSYGPPSVLKVVSLNKPEPAPGEILVKIEATSVTAAHTHLRTGKPYFGRLFIGLSKPKTRIPGTDFAGVVVAVGRDVKKFRVGDVVFGASDLKGSTYAEYLNFPENGVVELLPDGVSFAEASAAIDGGLTAMSFLRDIGKIKRGQHILINGASGSIGTAAVQLAKFFGAKVTGVCSAGNRELVKSLGADEVIDYNSEDFTGRLNTFDIIFDTVGKRSFSECKAALKENGLYMSPVLNLPLLFAQIKTWITGGKKALFSATGLRNDIAKKKDLQLLKELLEHGFLKPVIDRKYMLEQIANAHQYIETGRKRGNVVVELG